MKAANIQALEPYELQAVVDFFIYRLEPDERRRLMRELPQAYNKLMGSDIVTVVRTEDRAPIAKGE